MALCTHAWNAMRLDFKTPSRLQAFTRQTAMEATAVTFSPCANDGPTLGQFIRMSRWSEDLSEIEIRALESRVVERSAPIGSFVCRAGEEAHYWYGIVEGLVKMSSGSRNGTITTLLGMPAGGWLGEGTLLKNERRRYDIIALRDSRIACMPRDVLFSLLDSSVRFNRFLLDQLNERLGQFIGLMEDGRLMSTDVRVARCLASMFNPSLYPAAAPYLKISQEEIGHLSGTCRQRANQALHYLEDKGLIVVSRGGVTILDLDGLRSLQG